MRKESKNKIALLIVLVITLTIGIFFSHNYNIKNDDEGLMCTMEAKLCPDGTYVGRTGPACEFEECPKFSISNIDKSGWKTFSDSKIGMTFKYPASLSTKYIQSQDWPPQVQVLTGPFVCTDAGEPNARAGRTETKVINGHSYCKTTVAQGAAGSTYTEYAYEREIQGNIVYFTFTLRAPQCANYDDPQKTACDAEKVTFDVDNFIDTIIQTATFS